MRRLAEILTQDEGCIEFGPIDTCGCRQIRIMTNRGGCSVEIMHTVFEENEPLARVEYMIGRMIEMYDDSFGS